MRCDMDPTGLPLPVSQTLDHAEVYRQLRSGAPIEKNKYGTYENFIISYQAKSQNISSFVQFFTSLAECISNKFAGFGWNTNLEVLQHNKYEQVFKEKFVVISLQNTPLSRLGGQGGVPAEQRIGGSREEPIAAQSAPKAQKQEADLQKQFDKFTRMVAVTKGSLAEYESRYEAFNKEKELQKTKIKSPLPQGEEWDEAGKIAILRGLQSACERELNILQTNLKEAKQQYSPGQFSLFESSLEELQAKVNHINGCVIAAERDMITARYEVLDKKDPTLTALYNKNREIAQSHRDPQLFEILNKHAKVLYDHRIQALPLQEIPGVLATIAEAYRVFGSRGIVPEPFLTSLQDRGIHQIIDEKGQVSFYLFKKTLGEGGFGKVEGTVSLLTGKAEALKTIRPGIDGGGRAIAKEGLLKEFRVLKALNASGKQIGIPEAWEKRTYKGQVSLKGKEYTGGDATKIPWKKMNASQKAFTMLQPVIGLKFMHAKGFTHGDIKLQNLLGEELAPPLEGPLKRLFLGDHGGVQEPDKALEHTVHTSRYVSAWDLSCLSSYPEASPAQRKIIEEARKKNDIFALGCCLQEVFTNRAAFEPRIRNEYARPTNYHPIPADVVIPLGVRKLIGRMLSFDPKQRPSLEEVQAELMKHLTPADRKQFARL